MSDTAPTATHAPTSPYARRLPQARGRLWPAVGGAAVIALAGAGYFGLGTIKRWFAGAVNDPSIYVVEPMSFQIALTENGEIKPVQSEEIKCELEGQNTILSVVPESSRVKQGDLLLELASDQLKERLDTEAVEVRRLDTERQAAEKELEIQENQNQSDIKKAEIELEVAELELRKYLEGDYPQQVNSVEIDIKQAELDLERKRDELRKNRELLQREFVTKAKVEQLEFEVTRAELLLEKHKLARHILETYERPKVHKQKESDYDRAREELQRVKARADARLKQAAAKVEQNRSMLEIKQARLTRLEEQFKKCKIYAPNDGVVQYPTDEASRFGGNRIAAGEKVYEGQTLLVLPNTTQMKVTTRVHEADRHKVHEGLTCLISVPAVPGRTFTGTITKIGRFADSTNRWLNPELKEHPTEILLDATDAPLSPGDTAEVKILVDNVENALAVPVQCVYSRGRESFVFAQRGGSCEPLKVTLGRSNTSMVEVTAGLSPGDRVRMYADEGLLAKLPAPPPGAPQELGPPEALQGPGPGAGRPAGARPEGRPSGGERRAGRSSRG